MSTMRGVKDHGTYKAVFAEAQWWEKGEKKSHE